MDLDQLDLDDVLAFEPREDLDCAIIGFGGQACGKKLLIYDYQKLVNAFMVANNWTEDESIEWVDFNVVGAYVGEGTPIIMEALDGA